MKFWDKLNLFVGVCNRLNSTPHTSHHRENLPLPLCLYTRPHSDQSRFTDAMTRTIFFFLLLASVLSTCQCFIGSFVATDAIARSTSLYSTAATLLEEDTTYTSSLQTIDTCAATGVPSEDLYDAVRNIDRNASKLYPDDAAKEEMWKRAYGSWKLQLATGGGKFTNFKPVSIFAYAMIDENCFGNGVGLNQDTIILSLLGPHYFNTKKRVMGIGIEDMFLFSNKVTQFVPEFISNGMGLKKKPEGKIKCAQMALVPSCRLHHQLTRLVFMQISVERKVQGCQHLQSSEPVRNL